MLVTVVTLVLELGDEELKEDNVILLIKILTLVLVLEMEDEELEELDDGETVEELSEELLEDGDEELDEELDRELVEVMVMVGMVVERLLDELEDELEVDEGMVVVVLDVLTEVVDVVLDVLELVDVEGRDVLLNVSKMVSEVVVLSSVVVVVSPVSSPHSPAQATIWPLTHSVPAAVGPKLIRPPWSQMKKVRPPAPQNIWPSGAQLP